MQSCVEGSSDWSSCTGFAHQLSHHLPLPWRQGCVRAAGRDRTVAGFLLYFLQIFIYPYIFSLKFWHKASFLCLFSAWLCVLPLPALEVKVLSQGFHPWAMTGAWPEGSFLHQPSRGWSEMRLALGNLSILSVSLSVYEFHFRDDCSPTHSFFCTETVIGKTIKKNSHLSNSFHTMAAMAVSSRPTYLLESFPANFN